MLRTLLKMSRNRDPDEALLWALIEKNEDNVMEALKNGANANLSSPTGSRPLHAAALRGSVSIINILVGHKAKVDQANSEGFTPLMVAALNGRTDAVVALLVSGADPKQTRLDTGETALHMAMNSGSSGVVLELLDAGADINAQTTKEKFTPLHCAAKFDAKDMANVMLSDPLCEAETKDSKGRTAAEVARGEGHYFLAEHLDMCTAAKSEADKELVSAVMKLQEEAVRKALEAGANANLSSPTGSRPLHAAALRGSASIINTLVEYKAEVDQVDLEGFTPLMVAALNGRTDAVNTLLNNHANSKLTRLDTGETALHMAMDGRSQGVVEALLYAGAGINAQTTKDKFTPAHFAIKSGAMDLVKILLENAVNIRDIRQSKVARLSEERYPRTKTAPDTPDGRMVKMRVVTQEPTQPSESVYKVLSKPRGRVLILNYQLFAAAPWRYGAEKDEQRLKNLFTEGVVRTKVYKNIDGPCTCTEDPFVADGAKPSWALATCFNMGAMGYDATAVHRNLDKKKPKKTLKSFRNSVELGREDCVVVCVLSHGVDTRTFITSDDEEMSVGEVYDYFTDDQCPSLKGKPKLFLFNFCRGPYIEAGCILDSEGSSKRDAGPINANTEVDSQEIPPTTKMVLKDRVSLYATEEGVSALRDREGTFFVRAIVRIFTKFAHCLSVDDLAKRVNSHMTKRMRGTTTYLDSTTDKRFFLNPIQI